MNNISESLPIVIPAVLLHLGLAIFSLINLYKHRKVKRLNIPLWIVIILFVQTIGSICYLLLGRVDE